MKFAKDCRFNEMIAMDIDVNPEKYDNPSDNLLQRKEA